MEKLWSPWRSAYIDSFKSEKTENNCIFCNAISEDITSDNSLLIKNFEHTLVMLNLYPYNSGHLLIVPKRHTSEFLTFTPEELMEVNNVTKHSIAALKQIMNPHGFNYGANLGSAAGAGIADHIHFHIVPRWNGDSNFMPVLGEVKVISQDLLATKKKLIEAFAKL
ncbi:MAG: HIT domain-containing protein [Melioribacteraceae bacterium]|nr:HIT domain-containing protein [Melioribacteraceae bacterium]